MIITKSIDSIRNVNQNFFIKQIIKSIRNRISYQQVPVIYRGLYPLWNLAG